LATVLDVTDVATTAQHVRRQLPPWVEPAGFLVAGLGACAYIRLVDPNHSGAYPQCPTKMLTGLDCPLCGATRAVHSLIDGNLVGAMDHNLLFVLSLPLLAYAFVAWTSTRMGRPMKPLPVTNPRVIISVGVLMVVFAVVRNLPMMPFHWLNSATS
jgi:Protein of unknown function (DUF2752)